MSPENEAMAGTLLMGAFILAGMLCMRSFRRNPKFLVFSIGAAFSVMILLASLEILPEAAQTACSVLGTFGGYAFVTAFAAAGALVLKGLDFAVPDHHGPHGDSHHHTGEGIAHIGIMTSVALCIHNFIEGAGVYAVYMSDRVVGILYIVSVGLHNIPLGMIIGSSLFPDTGKKAGGIAVSALLVASSLIGAVVVRVFSIDLENALASGALLSASSGMILYIAFFELLEEVRAHLREHSMLLGCTAGFGLFFAGMFVLR